MGNEMLVVLEENEFLRWKVVWIQIL